MVRIHSLPLQLVIFNVFILTISQQDLTRPIVKASYYSILQHRRINNFIVNAYGGIRSNIHCALQCQNIDSTTQSNAFNFNSLYGECECVSTFNLTVDLSILPESEWKAFSLTRSESTKYSLDKCNDEIKMQNSLCLGQCIDSYQYIDGTRSCYKIHNRPDGVSQVMADLVCASEHTSLLKIETEGELLSLVSILSAFSDQQKNKIGWTFSSSATSYVRLPDAEANVPGMQFTILMWFRRTRSPSSTYNDHMLSYCCSQASDNCILIGIYPSTATLFMYIYSEHCALFEDMVMDDSWHHLAISWKGESGKYKVYLEGSLVASDYCGKGKVIPSGGTLLLGQDQDSCLGGFDVYDSFEGQLRDLQFFSTFLSNETIHDVYYGLNDSICGDVAGCSFHEYTVVGSHVSLDSSDSVSVYWVGAAWNGDNWQWMETCEEVSFNSSIYLLTPTGDGECLLLVTNTTSGVIKYEARRTNNWQEKFFCEQELC